MQSSGQNSYPLDVVAEVNGDEVIVELDVRNNARVRVGDQYTVAWEDGTLTIMHVVGFKSAERYSPTTERVMEAMREGVVGVPRTATARKAYQKKLAVLRIQGELLPDGHRIIGATRVPDVMVPVRRITDDILQSFVTAADGNLVLGSLRSGSRTLDRIARIGHNYAGERMVVFGMPGKGKSQLVRGLLSQAMAEDDDAQTDGVDTDGGGTDGQSS
jgi:flagellar biosynthesis/type III secretory pathway ATPase